MGRLAGLSHRLNHWAAHNWFFNKLFQFHERNTCLTQELRAGTATFLTVAYGLAVNSAVLSATGGPCIADGDCLVGKPPEVQSQQCQQCIQDVRKSLISATAAMGIISNSLMAFMGNMPVALAPAMGLNAYFTYTVVGYMGSGRVPYSQALTAVFLEGWIFLFLSIVRIRKKLVEYMPKSILLATSAGVGMFLAFIGLQASEGIGVVTYNGATLVTVGGCAPEYRLHQYTLSEAALDTACALPNGTCSAGTCSVASSAFTPSSTYSCMPSGIMRSPTMWLGIAGGMLMVVLMAWGVSGAFVIGIFFVTFVSWIPSEGNAARYLQLPGDTPPDQWTAAQLRWDYFKQVVAVPNISKTAGLLDFGGMGSKDLWVALITFLYVDFLDATGVLFSMTNFVSLYIPGFLNKRTKSFPRQTRTFCVDGTSIAIGSLMGLSPLTAAGESAAGIREGGRTGITSLTVAFYFFLALFFSPLLASIPPYATGPVLVLIGAMLISDVLGIHWRTVQEGVPAFITIITMPTTYSIAYGVIGGIISYCIINFFLFATYWIQACLFRRTIKPPAGRDFSDMRPFQIAYWLTFPHADEGDEPELEQDVHKRMMRPSMDQLGNLYAFQGKGEQESDKGISLAKEPSVGQSIELAHNKSKGGPGLANV